MEDVWKEITLDSLQDHSSREGLFSLNKNHHNLQDFLPISFSQHPHTNKVSSINGETTFFDSPLPLPATVLSLNSGPSGFNFIDNSYPPRPNSRLQIQSNPSALEPDSARRARRHKRMMKNRESAARSRARRQAYTNQLEFEFVHLKEEHARLKRQHEQLSARHSGQISTKRTPPQRTLSSPF